MTAVSTGAVTIRVEDSRGSRVAVTKPAAPARSSGYPVPFAGRPDGPAVLAEVLHSDGVTVGSPGERWHVKMYRCPTPEEAVLLERQLRAQSQLVLAANAEFARRPHHGLRWAVVPFHLAHEDQPPGEQPTRLGATAADVRAHPSTQMVSWFDDEAVQPDCCRVVVAPYLGPTNWEGEELTVADLERFETMAEGLDLLHEQGLAHCDVKPGNVRKLMQGAKGHFLLADGDSLTRLDSAPGRADLRLTEVPPALRGVLEHGGRLSAAQLREIDRFGFVLVVVAGLTEAALATRIFAEPDPGLVRGELYTRAQPHQRAVVELIGDALEPGALAADEWTATGWLAQLRDAADPRRADPLVVVPEPDPDLLARYRADVDAVAERLRRLGPVRPLEVPAALAAARDGQVAEVRRRERERLVRRFAVLTALVTLVLLIVIWKAS